MTTARLVRLRPVDGQTARVAGLVMGLRTLNSRRGRMAIATIDDRTARLDAVIYSDVYHKYRELLVRDKLLIIEGDVSIDEYSGAPSIVANAIEDIETARANRAKHVALRLDGQEMSSVFIHDLARTLEPYRRGKTPICIRYCRQDAAVPIRLGDAWRVQPTDELLNRLRDLAGNDRVEVEYP